MIAHEIERNDGGILKARAWVGVYWARAACPIKLNSLIVLGFLRYKRDSLVAPNYKEIAGATGIEAKRTVPGCLRELVEHGLAVSEGKGWRAVPPGQEHQGWFALGRDGKRRIFKYYLPSSETPLTTSANALYCLMIGFDPHRLRRNTKTGLAKMLGITRNTLKAGLRSLAMLGLAYEDEGGIRVEPPSTEAYWSPRPGKLKGSEPGQDLMAGEPTGARLVRIFTWHRQSEEIQSYLAERLVSTWATLRDAGYWQSDCRLFLKLVREETDDAWHALSYLAHAFPENFRQAEEYHTDKQGHYRCSLYVLLRIARLRGLPNTRERVSA